MERTNRQVRWQEWVTLALGAWVFISPWVFGMDAGSASAWNYYITGGVMVVFSGAAISANESAEWVSLVAAVWLFFSPWIVGNGVVGSARGDAVVAGILGVLFAAWGLAQHDQAHSAAGQR